ncbi:uncharacterized protein N7459_005751 [Penicillium hispanicum]|uniref:uncharacterized protein n=1 Tax=Penicillium hispanicum TaxID=1080232 RepID=UPI0025406B5F|nr:uncharacterized protein N7459_005751 [Penicillium hispanicum]KAJ5579766.1 hypothetical protein N7459_005751 [Penicillium hispanicum]
MYRQPNASNILSDNIPSPSTQNAAAWNEPPQSEEPKALDSGTPGLALQSSQVGGPHPSEIRLYLRRLVQPETGVEYDFAGTRSDSRRPFSGSCPLLYTPTATETCRVGALVSLSPSHPILPNHTDTSTPSREDPSSVALLLAPASLIAHSAPKSLALARCRRLPLDLAPWIHLLARAIDGPAPSLIR